MLCPSSVHTLGVHQSHHGHGPVLTSYSFLSKFSRTTLQDQSKSSVWVLEERYSYLKRKILRSGQGCCDLQRVFPSLVGAHAAEWEDLEGTK